LLKISEVLKRNNLRTKSYIKNGNTLLVDTNKGKKIIKKISNNIYEYLESRDFHYFPNHIIDNEYQIVDYIDETVLERINEKLQGQPDVLFVGLASYKNGVTNPNCLIPNYRDKYDAIQGWSGSSGKVIKKKLATRQECLYNEGTLKEDRNQHCKICIYMKSFKQLKEPVYVWNQSNYKSVTTIREKTIWGTSTIRHWADTLQLYLSEKGKDLKIDNYLKERVERAKSEVLSGGDRQW